MEMTAAAFVRPDDGSPHSVHHPSPHDPLSLVPTAPATPAHHVVGRDLEIGLCQDMVVQGATVVTLVGPAGVGTSTVAATVAGRLAEQGWARTRTLDLTQVRAPGEAVGLIAHAVAASRRSAEQGVVVVVEGAEEHLPAAKALAEWVAARHGVSLVLPALAPLRLTREHTVAVRPWRTTPDDDPDASQAVQFFLARMRQRNPRFSPDATDLGVIARIVHQVAGLPLAIDLVTRQVGPLSLAMIENQLARHSTPASSTVDRHLSTPRHQSIRMALNWASTPLTARTKRALWTCATFSSAFTLEAAAAVAGCSVSDMTGHVSMLLDLGLLESVTGDEGPDRLRVPQLVWVHAHEMLTGDPSLVYAATGRLMEYVAVLAAESARASGAREQKFAADTTLLVLRNDLAPLLDWTVEQRPIRAAGLVSDLVPFALRHGDEWDLGRRLVALTGSEVGDPDSDPEMLLRAAHLSLRCSMADEQAIGWLTEGITQARARGDHRLLLRGLALWMDALSSTGDVERTTAAVAEGLALSRQLGLARWEARFEAWTATLHHRRFEHDLALEHGTRALQLGRQTEDLRAIMAASLALRATPAEGREMPADLPPLQELWELVRQLSDIREATSLNTALAMTALRSEDFSEAADCLERQAKTIMRTGLWDLLVYTLFAGVMIAAHRNEWQATARWHGALGLVFDSLLLPLPASSTSWYAASVDRVRASRNPFEWDEQVREGAGTPWPEVAIELLELAGRMQLEASDEL